MANCSNCESELIIHKGEYNIYAYCTNCFEEKYLSRDREDCCFKPSLKAVKVKSLGENIRIIKQCENCGYSHGFGIKKADYDLDKLLFKDENKAEEFNKNYQLERIEYQKIFEEYKKQNYTIEIKIPGYNEYLRSPLWKKKRELVFKRDNFLCQACLLNPAVQVHHLSYRHVFNEPLFELTSVCIRCHDIITNMDRKNETEKIEH